MIEVFPNLYVGSEQDEHLARGAPCWFIIHACKEPYHRQALGYSGRAASKDHPEYLIAHRLGRLILNLVDVDNVQLHRRRTSRCCLGRHSRKGGHRKGPRALQPRCLQVAHNRFSLDGQAHGILSWPDARSPARQVQRPVPALQPRSRDGGICPDQLGALHALESDLVRPNLRSQDFSLSASRRVSAVGASATSAKDCADS